MAPRARQAKSKARLAAYEKLLAEDEATRTSSPSEIQIPAGPRLGDLVVEAEHLSKGYGDKLLFDDLSASRCRAAASSASSARTAPARPRSSG